MLCSSAAIMPDTSTKGEPPNAARMLCAVTILSSCIAVDHDQNVANGL